MFQTPHSPFFLEIDRGAGKDGIEGGGNTKWCWGGDYYSKDYDHDLKGDVNDLKDADEWWSTLIDYHEFKDDDDGPKFDHVMENLRWWR